MTPSANGRSRPRVSHGVHIDLTTPKNQRVLWLVTIVVIGTWMSTAYHYMLGDYLGSRYPLNTFLFKPWDHFADFINLHADAQSFVAGQSTVISYSPFAQMLTAILTIVDAPIALVASLAAFLIGLVSMVGRYLVDGLRSHVSLWAVSGFVLVAMTYPVLFVMDRGNQEMFVFLFLLAFLYLYTSRRSRWAGIFLGAAIAFKVYPAVLLVLLVSDRRWKDLLIAVGTFLGLTGVSAAALASWSGYRLTGVFRYWSATLFGSDGHLANWMTARAVQHGHSLWGAVISALPDMRSFGLAAPMRTYAVFAVLIFTAAGIYVTMFEETPWKRMAILVVAMLVLPFESHDYTLINLFLPLALFVGSPRCSFDGAYTMLFGALLIPLDYWIVINDVSVSVFLYPALMVAMVGLIVWQRFAERRSVVPEGDCR